MTRLASISCYAIRRVNPFLGVLQVIETETGRAVSANGVVWDIEIGVPVKSGWGSLNQHENRLAYYRYGLWSEAEGLVNRPLAPQLDNDPLSEQADILIHAIKSNLPNLPFRLEDSHELWLFDQHDQFPLALLATSRDTTRLPSPEPRYWSASSGRDGVPSQRRFPETDRLEKQVKHLAGFNVRRHWIKRLPDGSGQQMKADRIFERTSFPAFLIADRWQEDTEKKRVDAFINWTAPALLTLQNLDFMQRQRLETALVIQSQSIEHHWKLYPEIIDEQNLNTARVQCRLQQSSAE